MQPVQRWRSTSRPTRLRHIREPKARIELHLNFGSSFAELANVDQRWRTTQRPPRLRHTRELPASASTSHPGHLGTSFLRVPSLALRRPEAFCNEKRVQEVAASAATLKDSKDHSKIASRSRCSLICMFPVLTPRRRGQGRVEHDVLDRAWHNRWCTGYECTQHGLPPQIEAF